MWGLTEMAGYFRGLQWQILHVTFIGTLYLTHFCNSLSHRGHSGGHLCNQQTTNNFAFVLLFFYLSVFVHLLCFASTCLCFEYFYNDFLFFNQESTDNPEKTKKEDIN